MAYNNPLEMQSETTNDYHGETAQETKIDSNKILNFVKPLNFHNYFFVPSLRRARVIHLNQIGCCPVFMVHLTHMKRTINGTSLGVSLKLITFQPHGFFIVAQTVRDTGISDLGFHGNPFT
ncbi:hypothetical protein C5167_044898 [Papaver somniferum]|uniref:Uncharacterized protein n=1 Tax=Papaver somniferum TaxID=3469 RepID=A0A4Y7LCV2_PAPSO|nr:hypothetical protein C5167_044898 [Papaver somniferum]